MAENLEHKMEEHAAPHEAPHPAANSAPAGEVSGLEKSIAKAFYGIPGYVISTWKAIPAYIWAASSAAYASMAVTIAGAVAVGSLALKYIINNYVLNTKFGKEFYAGAKDITLNSFTYAKNFLTATAGFLQNLITFPGKILSVYGASDNHGAAPKEDHAAPHPA